MNFLLGRISLPVLLQEFCNGHLVEPPDFTWISESYIQLSILEIELIVRELGGPCQTVAVISQSVLSEIYDAYKTREAAVCNFRISTCCVYHIEIAMVYKKQTAFENRQENFRVYLSQYTLLLSSL